MNQQPKTDMLIAFAERLISTPHLGRTQFLGHFITNELAQQFPEQFEKRGNHVVICSSGLKLDSHLGQAFNLATCKQEELLYKMFNFSNFYKKDDLEKVSKEQIAHAISDFCIALQSSESVKI